MKLFIYPSFHSFIHSFFYLFHFLLGIGNDFSQEELGLVSINGQLGLSGTIPSLPALIGRILFGLTTSKLIVSILCRVLARAESRLKKCVELSIYRTPSRIEVSVR